MPANPRTCGGASVRHYNGQGHVTEHLSACPTEPRWYDIETDQVRSVPVRDMGGNIDQRTCAPLVVQMSEYCSIGHVLLPLIPGSRCRTTRALLGLGIANVLRNRLGRVDGGQRDRPAKARSIVQSGSLGREGWPKGLIV